MTNTIILTIVILSGLGLLLALVLFLVAKKFKVEEDPRIDDVEKLCPVRTVVAADLPDAVHLQKRQ